MGATFTVKVGDTVLFWTWMTDINGLGERIASLNFRSKMTQIEGELYETHMPHTHLHV